MAITSCNRWAWCRLPTLPLCRRSCNSYASDGVRGTFCRYNPIKTTKTSFMGTMNMLGLAKRTKVGAASTLQLQCNHTVHILTPHSALRHTRLAHSAILAA